jgi:hypothetical protein
MQRCDIQSISIEASPQTVLELVADALRLPDWAPDFARTVRPDGDAWIIESGEDELRIRIRLSSEHGTVDFLAADVPAGVELGAFSRVVANGAGSEYSFTQFFSADLPDADVARRKAVVAEELRTVRKLCEESRN